MINTSDCWLFAGYKNELGYGQIFTYIDRKQSYQYAHRVMYENFVGNIPEGLVIDHLCKVRCCINPNHLEAVSARVNTLRGDGVLANTRKTHCPMGHKYTEGNLVKRKTGWRQCKKCHAINRMKLYNQNKKS